MKTRRNSPGIVAYAALALVLAGGLVVGCTDKNKASDGEEDANSAAYSISSKINLDDGVTEQEFNEQYPIEIQTVSDLTVYYKVRLVRLDTGQIVDELTGSMKSDTAGKASPQVAWPKATFDKLECGVGYEVRVFLYKTAAMSEAKLSERFKTYKVDALCGNLPGAGASGGTASGGTGGGGTASGGTSGGTASGGTSGGGGNPAAVGGESGFSKLGDGSVKDNETGLIWQPHDASGSTFFTWNNARSYCGNWGGYGRTGWRLPNMYELHSATDFSSSPVTDSVLRMGRAFYWSSLAHSNTATSFWRLSFDRGESGYANQGGSSRVRCVVGEGLAPWSFGVSGTGANRVVRVNGTNIVWQGADGERAVSGGSTKLFDWSRARSYCDGLSYAGRSDWRLPTIKELARLVDYGKYNPAADSALGLRSDNYYWSSTEAYPTVASTNSQISVHNNAQTLEFKEGKSGMDLKYNQKGYVRCIAGS